MDSVNLELVRLCYFAHMVWTTGMPLTLPFPNVFATEWWLFDHRDWKEYAILDVEFGRVGGR